jgi:hypothetical protein
MSLSVTVAPQPTAITVDIALAGKLHGWTKVKSPHDRIRLEVDTPFPVAFIDEGSFEKDLVAEDRPLGAENDQVNLPRNRHDLELCRKVTEQTMAVIRRLSFDQYQAEIDVAGRGLTASGNRAEQVNRGNRRRLPKERLEPGGKLDNVRGKLCHTAMISQMQLAGSGCWAGGGKPVPVPAHPSEPAELLWKAVDQYIAFISYAHHYRQWVEVLHRNLELCLQHHGIEHKVFLDRTDLGSGAWLAQLQEGLEKAAHLILVATPEAIASPRVADEYETFMSIRRDWGRGHLHLLHLVEAPLPAMLRSLQQIDLRNHDEAAYRDGLARLVAGLLRRPGSRDLPELADKIEIPPPPQSALPSTLRQRLADWLEPAVAGKRARRNTAAALGLERTALDHHEQPDRAASAAIAAATGDDDPVAAALRIIRIMADELEDGEQQRAAELQALRHEIEGSSGTGAVC